MKQCASNINYQGTVKMFTVPGMQCKSLWIKASAKCTNTYELSVPPLSSQYIFSNLWPLARETKLSLALYVCYCYTNIALLFKGLGSFFGKKQFYSSVYNELIKSKNIFKTQKIFVKKDNVLFELSIHQIIKKLISRKNNHLICIVCIDSY